jgi:hypothetical protein
MQVLVGETPYELVLSPHREFVNGAEVESFIDHAEKRITIASVGQVIERAVSVASETLPVAPIQPVEPDRSPERPRRIRVRMNGCFLVDVIPWDHWGEEIPDSLCCERR